MLVKYTLKMQERGVLIRESIPAAVSELLPQLSSLMGATGADLDVTGSDGLGKKAQAPWVRLFSKSRSPSPTVGYYVVIHFSVDGRRIYVTIGCAATVWDGNAGRLQACRRHSQRGTEPRSAGADHYDLIFVIDDFVCFGHNSSASEGKFNHGEGRTGPQQ